MEQIINGVRFQPTGDTEPVEGGTSHIVELLNANTAWGSLQSLIGVDVPTIGVVASISAARLKFYPAGQLVGLVVAA